MIRKANTKDIKLILSLWMEMVRFHSNLPGWRLRKRDNATAVWEKELRKNIRSRKSLVLVSENEKGITGYILAHRDDFPAIYKENSCLYIDDCFVVAKLRRQGIAKAFLLHTARYCRKNKIRNLSLHAFPTNKKAVLSWRRLGFSLQAEYYTKRIY